MEQEKHRKRQIIAKGCFVIYLALLLYFLLFADRAISEGGVNLIPLKEISRYITYRNVLGYQLVLANLAGNIIGFFPFGFLLAAMNRRFEKVWLVVLCSFGLSLLVETIQLVTKVGCYDVDDILLNTLGGCLGVLVRIVITRLRSRKSGVQKETTK